MNERKGAAVQPTLQAANVSARASSPATVDHINDPDQAYVFLDKLGATGGFQAEVSIKAIRRKVDWRIVPLMFGCYTLQFVDKVSLNYAAVMGLNPDLNLRGNDFSNAATAFFIAYLVAEVPTGYILNKVPASKYLGINVVLWGIATACTAACHNYGSLLAARIFLGIFEAAIAPCLMLISSQWYTRSEAAPRFSFWYCGLGVGQIFGGIVSYGFQQVNTSFQGWRIMFVFLGVLTVIIGFITFFFLPDTPMTARFLSDTEKAAILHHVAPNQTGVQNTRFVIRHIWEALLDVQLWLLTLITVLISISSGVVTTYSATLIRNIGYRPDTAALLNMPSGIVSIAATIIVGLGVRYIGPGHRWFWLILCCVPGILGGGLMSFLPSGKTNANKAGLLAGIYLVNSIVATLIILYQWTASNVAGHTKRVFSVSLIAGAFSVGNIIGPQTFQAKGQGLHNNHFDR
jgi:sugar phosphate permease